MIEADHTLRRGKIFIISAPSAAGKSTLIKGLLENDPTRFFSVSTTTRPMRPGEVDGVNYHYVDDAEFNSMIRDNKFLEYVDNSYDKRYGTPRAPIMQALADGRDVLLDIESDGVAQVLDALPDEDIKTIFLVPGGKKLVRPVPPKGTSGYNEWHHDLTEAQKILEQRLRMRNDTTEEQIRIRVESVPEIIAKEQSLHFDHVIDSNQDIPETLADAESYIAAAHGRHYPLNRDEDPRAGLYRNMDRIGMNVAKAPAPGNEDNNPPPRGDKVRWADGDNRKGHDRTRSKHHDRITHLGGDQGFDLKL